MFGLSYVCAFFTHNLLFLLLNLMIAAIAFVSAFTNKRKHQNQHLPDHEHKKSIDFFAERVQSLARYLFDKSPQRTETEFVRDPSADDFYDALEEIVDEENEVLCIDDFCSKLTVSHSNTSTVPAAATGKPAHFVDKEIVEERRPAAVRGGGADGDEEVDAKADDFINRFKQQLKLQTLDPINRYK